MTKFRSPSRGGNLVHRIDLPGLGKSAGSRRRETRGPSRRRGTANPSEAAGQASAGQALGAAAPPAQPLPAYVLPTQGPRDTDLERTPAVLEDSQARKQIDVLERRLAKMARLLDQRDVEIVARSRQEEDTGVASIYRGVQGVDGVGDEVKQKKALMSSIFEANLKLREMVTSTARDAD
ncbi:hypothetical protein Poly30_26750 [Planctomycetes bacterium Poly30]|uniref:Uncharacterized protein n=1 Tax=Saltatorellus ferox TaxID=2528018 RepID=A0A518ESU3_9BACT|nr:hypothetical protein Poly30_26750 [Planctomycetes bacterium Poly30]